MLDVRGFSDRRYTRHTGLFPWMQEHIAGSRAPWGTSLFEEIVLGPIHKFVSLAREQNFRNITIMLLCNHGVHRSVACAELIGRVLDKLELPQVVHEIKHLNLERFDPPRCSCSSCNKSSRTHEEVEVLDSAVAPFVLRWRELDG